MSEPEIRRVVIVVRGRVQGVGYRYSAWRKARDLDLHGYVRNLPDGSVTIDAEGPGEILEEFISWCMMGPARAIVEHTDVSWHPPAGYKKFMVR